MTNKTHKMPFYTCQKVITDSTYWVNSVNSTDEGAAEVTKGGDDVAQRRVRVNASLA